MITSAMASQQATPTYCLPPGDPNYKCVTPMSTLNSARARALALPIVRGGIGYARPGPSPYHTSGRSIAPAEP